MQPFALSVVFAERPVKQLRAGELDPGIVAEVDWRSEGSPRRWRRTPALCGIGPGRLAMSLT